MLLFSEFLLGYQGAAALSFCRLCQKDEAAQLGLCRQCFRVFQYWHRMHGYRMRANAEFMAAGGERQPRQSYAFSRGEHPRLYYVWPEKFRVLAADIRSNPNEADLAEWLRRKLVLSIRFHRKPMNNRHMPKDIR